MSSRRLVPGDVVVLVPGKATCDMVLLTGNCLVEESVLSGEVHAFVQVIEARLPQRFQLSIRIVVAALARLHQHYWLYSPGLQRGFHWLQITIESHAWSHPEPATIYAKLVHVQPLALRETSCNTSKYGMTSCQ